VTERKPRPKAFNVARDNDNKINIAIADVYLGIRFSVRQYPIENRKWNLKLPVLALDAAKKKEDFYSLNAPANELKLKGGNDEPRHPFDPSHFLPPKNLYDMGTNRDSPTSMHACVTMQSPLIKAIKTGWRPVKDSEKDEKKAEASSLNAVLGQALAVYVTRNNTYRVNNTGRFECGWIAGHDNPIAATEKLALKLFAFVKTTINDKAGIFEIINGAPAAQAISEDAYDKRKRIEDDQFSGENCGGMPLIPGVMQVTILVEHIEAESFVLSEVYCDGDRMFSLT